MKVGLNATCLNDRPSGAKQRFAGIYGPLFRRLPDTDFVIYEPRDCRVTKWFDGQPNVRAQITPVPSSGRWGKFGAGLGYWGQALPRESFDLFEAMHLPMVRPRNGAAILTLHDVRGLYDDTDFFRRKMFAMFLRRALLRADHVVTVSSAMRDEILAFFPQADVSVVYNGFDANVFADFTHADFEAFTMKYKLPSDFLLAVGHFEPRKNYARLIEAMTLLKRRGLDCPLVIVGNDSGERAALERKIEALNLTGQVILLTGLPDREVRCAYLSCQLFVFPSSYEGFGIPILEAMAAGCPMVLSNLPVFKEITEGQATYFLPESATSIADAIELCLNSSEDRERMKRYGAKRIADFGFDQLAGQVCQIYQSYL